MRSHALRTAAALLCAAAVTIAPATPALADQTRNDQWHLDFLNVTEAHKHSQGEGVIVAVIDSGVAPHPDLNKNILPGTDVVPGGTGDGRQDQDGHGTAIAGLIAAHGHGKNAGALGIAPKAKILPVRDKSAQVTGNSDHTAAGIEYAMRNGAKVINISSTGTSTPRLEEAVKAALAADVVVVAGSGNQPDYNMGFPAFYDGVVAVGATDRKGNLSKITVTGKGMVITAPGQSILTTDLNGGYSKWTGTSTSTAIVSGAAALIRSKFPELSAEEVIHRLTSTAVDKGAPGWDPEYGHGVLDLVAALTADVPPLPEPTPTASAVPPFPTLTAEAAPPPGTTTNSNTTLLVIGASTLAAIGLATAFLLAVRTRRRTPQPNPTTPIPTGPPGSAGPPHGPSPMGPPGQMGPRSMAPPGTASPPHMSPPPGPDNPPQAPGGFDPRPPTGPHT